ncbi:J domain-containing protein-like isoform X1 [Haliotis rufescens]|uniref:J domain-containing protein-like isoform X1 n=2 Tax=Haliotis rufescens TaxID=6454 RepID=UPI001EB09956|nr:J domain-containing protein-like isoform X1 [Haliotis rufescens]
MIPPFPCKQNSQNAPVRELGMEEILNFERKLEDDYYQILGCDELSNTEQIVKEYKARVLDCHPDKHPEDPTAAEQFARLQTAKETLCDPESRAKYDQWRQSGMMMTYGQWKGLRDSVHTSMHWGSVKTKPMLDDSQGSSFSSPKHGQTTLLAVDSTSAATGTPAMNSSPGTSPKKEVPWERDPASNMLRKFRNYEV